MRIIIEIEGVEATNTTTQPQVGAKIIAPPSEIPEVTETHTSLPPEVLRTATALGADSAGPAPEFATESGVSYEKPPSFGYIAEAEFDEMDAGEATGIEPDDEPDLEVEEEPEEKKV
jgi:hypothetical protein